MPVKRKSAVSGTGGITVFMVLAVLTVAVFAVLTLSSAMADQRLSEKNAANVQLYYEVENRATVAVAAIEAAWAVSGSDADSFIYGEAEGLVTEDIFWWGEDAGQMALSIPVEGDRTFEAGIRLLDDANGQGRRVEIFRWNLMPANFGEVISPMDVYF